MVFAEAHRELIAGCPAEAPELLAEVERATALGSWAAGFVSYEAAGGLDSGVVTRVATPGEPFEDLPPAWFGLFGAPQDSGAAAATPTCASTPRIPRVQRMESTDTRYAPPSTQTLVGRSKACL